MTKEIEKGVETGHLAALMGKAQQGDKQAYKKLLSDIRPMILGFLSRRIRDSHVCDDLCQDILIKIHTYRDTYDPKQKFEPWMYSITRNSMIDFFRKDGRRKESISFVGELPETAMEAFDLASREQLLAALSALPEDQKKAIELVKLEGKTIAEAAKLTSSSESAVKVRIHRAYKSLSQSLAG